MLPGASIKPQDVVTVLFRRRWIILIPFALGLALAPWIDAKLPKIYRSETLIMVVPQRVPDSYVRSTVTATVEDRLPTISEQILSRTRLERVITDFDLYPELRRQAAMEDVVARMRGDIGPVQIGPKEQSFRVTFANAEPAVAQKVAARLASLFIEENSRDRESLAESTNVFLESQLEDVSRRLVEHEKKVEEFNRRFSGELPSQLSSNLQSISTAQIRLQALTETQNRARERRLLFERQLADAQIIPASVVQSSGTTSDALAGQTVAQQLETMEARLAATKLRFTSDHPDVRALERTVRELRVKSDEEARRPRDQAPVAVSPAELVRQKRIHDLEAEIEVIDRQLAVSQADEAKLKSQIEDYQRKVDAVPGRESELVELTRDYDILKKTYETLLTKREDSKLAANLERRQIGEQFRILDPASLPAKPDNERNRLVFTFAAAIAGLLLGLLLAGLLEFRDTSFAREEDVVRLLSLPVLALVPVMASDKERRVQRRRRLAVDSVAIAVLIAAIGPVLMWGLAEFR